MISMKIDYLTSQMYLLLQGTSSFVSLSDEGVKLAPTKILLSVCVTVKMVPPDLSNKAYPTDVFLCLLFTLNEFESYVHFKLRN